jgi:hypothetical protein
MRIWSLHPQYLDAKGLVALWRETLLAKHVLEGKTKGYKSHPQLDRFKRSPQPLDAINQYLAAVYEEASTRGYCFDRDKIGWGYTPQLIRVTSGQMQYETKHLLAKLKERDPGKFKEVNKLDGLSAHPMFRIVKGEIEKWEIIK